MYNAFDEYMPYEMEMQAGTSAGEMGGIFSPETVADGFGGEGEGGMGFLDGGVWGVKDGQ